MTGRALVVVALLGCNQLLGVKDTVTHDAAGETFDRCGPLAYDANRYRAMANNGNLTMTFQFARSACAEYGMDLAVLDAKDTDELVRETFGAQTPFWFGITSNGTTYSGIDDCEPAFNWRTGEPVSTAIGNCVIQAAGGMVARSCSDQDLNSINLNALCETPRLDERCTQLVQHSTYLLLDRAGHGHDDAVNLCTAQGMHLVEINSTAELDHVRLDIAPGLSFWVGATWGGAAWMTPTGCPAVFAWRASNEPTFGGGGYNCLIDFPGMASVSCTDAGMVAGVVCESNP